MTTFDWTTVLEWDRRVLGQLLSKPIPLSSNGDLDEKVVKQINELLEIVDVNSVVDGQSFLVMFLANNEKLDLSIIDVFIKHHVNWNCFDKKGKSSIRLIFKRIRDSLIEMKEHWFPPTTINNLKIMSKSSKLIDQLLDIGYKLNFSDFKLLVDISCHNRNVRTLCKVLVEIDERFRTKIRNTFSGLHCFIVSQSGVQDLQLVFDTMKVLLDDFKFDVNYECASHGLFLNVVVASSKKFFTSFRSGTPPNIKSCYLDYIINFPGLDLDCKTVLNHQSLSPLEFAIRCGAFDAAVLMIKTGAKVEDAINISAPIGLAHPGMSHAFQLMTSLGLRRQPKFFIEDTSRSFKTKFEVNSYTIWSRDFMKKPQTLKELSAMSLRRCFTKRDIEELLEHSRVPFFPAPIKQMLLLEHIEPLPALKWL